MTPLHAFEALRAYRAARRVAGPSLDRAAFERWRDARLERWLRRDLPRVEAYRDAPPRLDALPVTDKAALLADFARHNRPGITAEEAREAAAGSGRIGRYVGGSSSGTTGRRGLFVVSRPETYRWLGSILAKTLHDLLPRPQRVALVLPAASGLYDSARGRVLLRLEFFSLAEGPERWREKIEAFDPTVVVAPPQALRHMAEEGFRLAPARVFSAAETLDPLDRTLIERALGLRLDEIYMASEGLFAVTCRRGRLHLAEDSVLFELEPVGGADERLVSPLVTAFRRDTQIMARYRMNDLLRMAPEPCACGSPLQTVDAVIGRMDDAFRFEGGGRTVLVTPDVLRNAVTGADPRIEDFRLAQRGGDVALRLDPSLPDEAASRARGSVQALLDARGTGARVSLLRASMPPPQGRKLRRVSREPA